MHRHRRALALLLLASLPLASVALVAPTGGASQPQEGEMSIESFDGTLIDVTVCKPTSASATNRVPVVLHSHGWAGAKSGCGSFGFWLDRGVGVVSITQRGFGDSGGESHIHDPDYEGRDNLRVIDRVATFDWVLLEGPGDPVMGAIGGSYGGGYQLMIAMLETATTGSTRLDALAPEITWYDLPESLAPQGVVRTAWVAALYAAGAKDVHAGIHQAFAYAMATGQLPDGTVPGVYDAKADLHGNGPAYWVEQGVRLDVPVLVRQGATDNLFNLNQGWKVFERALTDEARAKSLFIGYNGGHALPNAFPLGVGGSGDPCGDAHGGFRDLTLAFFRQAWSGEVAEGLPAHAYSLATTEGACVQRGSLDPTTSVEAGTLALATGAGAPLHVPLAEGPLTLAGIPQVRATLTSVGVDQRAFLALSVGKTPLDARVLGNNVMPLRAALPALEQDVTVELAGVAATLAEGETLYLTLSPVSDVSFAHGSRIPGAIVLEDVVVDLPIA